MVLLYLDSHTFSLEKKKRNSLLPDIYHQPCLILMSFSKVTPQLSTQIVVIIKQTLFVNINLENAYVIFWGLLVKKI